MFNEEARKKVTAYWASTLIHWLVVPGLVSAYKACVWYDCMYGYMCRQCMQCVYVRGCVCVSTCFDEQRAYNGYARRLGQSFTRFQ